MKRKKLTVRNRELYECPDCGCIVYKSIVCKCLKDHPKYKRRSVEYVKSHVSDLNTTRFKKSTEKFTWKKSWKRLKRNIIEFYGRQCMKCDGYGELHVDHIKPRCKYPELSLDPTNLQILCKPCNLEKSHYHETDYRTAEQLEDFLENGRNLKWINHYWPKKNRTSQYPKRKHLLWEKEKKRKNAEIQERIDKRPKVIRRKKEGKSPPMLKCLNYTP